jgi:hypothetical protein
MCKVWTGNCFEPFRVFVINVVARYTLPAAMPA